MSAKIYDPAFPDHDVVRRLDVGDEVRSTEASREAGALQTAIFNSVGNGNTVINLGAGVIIQSLTFDTAQSSAYVLGSGAAGSQTLTHSVMKNESGFVPELLPGGSQLPNCQVFELSSAAFGEELNPLAVPIREDLVGDSDPAPSLEDLDG